MVSMMAEKIMIEFTGEEIDKILKYQKKLQEITTDEFLERFPDEKMDTVQKAIMNAIEGGLCNPRITV